MTATVRTLLGLSTFLLVLASCQSSELATGPDTRTTGTALAHPGRWDIPASTLAIGDEQNVTYDDSGPFDGGIHCAPWLTPGAAILHDTLPGYFPQIHSIGGYNCRAVGDTNTMSQHGTGRALDIYITEIDGEADNDAGDPIGIWLIEHAESIGIQAIIWDRTIWKVSRTPRAQYYGGDSAHTNHLHVEITEEAGAMETDWFANPYGPEPCDTIPPTQTIVSEDGPCFSAFGPAQYWRTEPAGEGGSLKWTNAFDKADPSNWARWNLVFETAGEYEVEAYIDPTWGVFSATRYGVVAAGQETTTIIDQGSANGWTSLGTYHFEEGRDQHVSVYDNYPSPGSDQHIAVDAIRLTPGQLEVCEALPAEGGVIEETGRCFEKWGLDDYWRTEAAGHDGSLFWTNAFAHDTPGNWARWNVILSEAGSYEVEVYLEPAFAVYPQTRYGVKAGGAEQTVILDQSAASGWVPLGTFDFAAGGDQAIEIYDNYEGTVPSDQHLAIDAIQLTRAGARCGDGSCDAGETCDTCADDCGTCETCGDGICAAAEDCASCEDDCGACVACGDGICDASEACETCPADCGACTCTGDCHTCGDGTCDADESCEDCVDDCGSCPSGCGDGVCDADETCASCESDCGLCAGCGDGTCADTESCTTCAADCTCDPAACGDGVCAHESCTTCPEDCGACSIGPADDDAAAGAAKVNEGCSCSVLGRSTPSSAWALLLVALAVLTGHRARRR